MTQPIAFSVTDSVDGRPAVGLHAVLQYWDAGRDWRQLGEALTGEQGGPGDWLCGGGPLPPGVYRIMFDVRAYYERRRIATSFPVLSVVFDYRARDGAVKLHIALSPHGYTVYKG